jgi:hypothetical protein
MDEPEDEANVWSSSLRQSKVTNKQGILKKLMFQEDSFVPNWMNKQQSTPRKKSQVIFMLDLSRLAQHTSPPSINHVDKVAETKEKKDSNDPKQE